MSSTQTVSFVDETLFVEPPVFPGGTELVGSGPEFVGGGVTVVDAVDLPELPKVTCPL